MYEKHPELIIPEDETILWRYMDFTKFVSILSKRELFFASPTLFNDQLEGSVTRLTLKNRVSNTRKFIDKIVGETNGDPVTEAIWDAITEKSSKETSKSIQANKRTLFFSCWHMNSYESAAMWDLYLASKGAGIAIRTSLESFKLSFSDTRERIWMGAIQYYDQHTDEISTPDALTPFFYKRKSYGHEQELRAVTRMLDENGKAIKPSTESNIGTLPRGIYIKTKLETLIEEIYVAPTAPDWFFEMVESVLKVYRLDKKVMRSSLDDAPMY